MEALLVDYQYCVSQVNLKEEETKVCSESLYCSMKPGTWMNFSRS
ncbi:hypothetical protein Zm00014a_025918 [Zea mays]|uniref:Uncharacterized protein n=1 Tax=Zea mays TaxID=4577 RepID=A0A3L6F3J7_MAIZE|nr:hypothetical protein Zm00014a_025918 [Zea mays]